MPRCSGQIRQHRAPCDLVALSSSVYARAIHVLLALVALGTLAALGWYAAHLAPAREEVRLCMAPSGRCWQMTECQVAGKSGYTLCSVPEDSAWNRRFRDKAVCWLYILRSGNSTLLLQMQNGALYELNLDSGAFRLLPGVSEPLPPAVDFFHSLVPQAPKKA